MNNKYDVNNFSKLIDEFKKDREVQAIQEHLKTEFLFYRENNNY
jgi:hypothetical protein